MHMSNDLDAISSISTGSWTIDAGTGRVQTDFARRTADRFALL